MSFWGSQGYQTVTFSLEWRMLHQIVNVFHFLRVLVLQKSAKILLCVSLEVEPASCPKAALLFFDCSSLVLESLPSLISNCLNLPFGTQGRSWRLEPIPYKQEVGDIERLLCPGPPQGPAVSLPPEVPWFQGCDWSLEDHHRSMWPVICPELCFPCLLLLHLRI